MPTPFSSACPWLSVLHCGVSKLPTGLSSVFLGLWNRGVVYIHINITKVNIKAQQLQKQCNLKDTSQLLVLKRATRIHLEPSQRTGTWRDASIPNQTQIKHTSGCRQSWPQPTYIPHCFSPSSTLSPGWWWQETGRDLLLPVIQKTEVISPRRRGSSHCFFCCSLPYRCSTSMLPVSTSENKVFDLWNYQS